MVRCLMVETGEEAKVLRLLKIMELGRGIFPQRVRVRKIRGVWRKDHIRLLPGYVFVFQDEDIPVRYYQRVEHVLKVLRYDREPDGYLRGNDLEFARLIRELDGKMDILGAVDEAGFIRVTDALLKKLHGEVLSVDKGKHQVKIRVTLVGQPRIIHMNYQLLDDEGKPLDPVTEILDDEEDEWLTAWTPDFAEDLAERMDQENGDGGNIAPEGYWDGLEGDEAAYWQGREPTERNPGQDDGSEETAGEAAEETRRATEDGTDGEDDPDSGEQADRKE